jgi:mRNA interferase HigB
MDACGPVGTSCSRLCGLLLSGVSDQFGCQNEAKLFSIIQYLTKCAVSFGEDFPWSANDCHNSGQDKTFETALLSSMNSTLHIQERSVHDDKRFHAGSAPVRAQPAYARTHPETAVPLERWYRLVKAANWTSMDDMCRASPKSKVLNRDRARFEVAGGNSRLIAAFDFGRQIVFVKFIGTHAEYDAIDALTIARF